MKKLSIAVVGAGMAGLSAAFHLHKMGFDVTVFEEHDQPGGRTQSLKKQGYTIDLGAATLAPSYHYTLQLLREAQAEDLLVDGKTVLGIVRNRKLIELNLQQPLRTSLAPFLSTGAKLQLVKLIPDLARSWSKSSFSSMASLASFDTETCQEFGLRRCGKEVHDYLIDPVVRLNMFSDTLISSRVDFQWLVKIFSAASIVQVAGGMGEMSQRIAAKLPVHYKNKVKRVHQQNRNVTLDINGKLLVFDAAIIAVPPPVAAKLVDNNSPAIQWLAERKPVSSMTIHIGLNQTFPTNAGICMMPSCENPDVIAFIYEHNKCPGRAPAGKSCIAIHMSATWIRKQGKLGEKELAKRAVASLSRSLPPNLAINNDAIEMVHLHRWDYVDCERPPGSYKALSKIESQFNQGRVQFAGEYISAGIEGAVISGKRCAYALEKTLAQD